MKRFISFVLTLCVVVSVLSTFAFAGSTIDVYGYKDCSVIAGNVTLPLVEYPVGSYATRDGQCHNEAYCLDTYPLPGGGSVYVYGTQCLGFARYVFYRCFGVIDCTFTGRGGYYSVVENVGYVSSSYLSDLFNSSDVLPGAHIRIAYSSAANDGHSMIYLKSDDTYIYTYECNLKHECDVTVVRRTWSQMAEFTNNKGGLAFVHMPDYYPDTLDWDCASDGHKWNVTEDFLPTGLHEGRYTKVCGICGAKEQEVFECGLCAMGTSCPGHSFSDMPAADNWSHNAIEYGIEYALLSGLGDDRFDPNGSMTRAMLVNVLWRVAGKPSPEGKLSFSDIPDDSGNKAWYTDSVLWAAECGIASGVGNGKFKPNAEVTREQIAVILCNFSKYQQNNASSRKDLSGFADSAKISSWANEAVSWAVAEGYISGKENNGAIKLDPQGNATRAEVASILTRYVKPQYDSLLRIGTINSNYVNIRAGASTSTAVVSSASTGTQILVLYEIGGWYRIRTAKGTLGYIRKDFVDISEPVK